jgi:hypothetical protein
MPTPKFTLLLTGLPDLVLDKSAGQLFLPSQLGLTNNTGRNTLNYPTISTAGNQPYGFTFDAALNVFQFAVFQQYLFEQEQGTDKGNIILRNEYFGVNADWATLYNRTVHGSAMTVGTLTQRYIQYPVLILPPEDWFEPLASNSQGLWFSVRFTAEELLD